MILQGEPKAVSFFLKFLDKSIITKHIGLFKLLTTRQQSGFVLNEFYCSFMDSAKLKLHL